MRRLLLVRHAPTGATRAAAFPLDEPVEPGPIALTVPRGCEVLCSPALRCNRLAAAATRSGPLAWAGAR